MRSSSLRIWVVFVASATGGAAGTAPFAPAGLRPRIVSGRATVPMGGVPPNVGLKGATDGEGTDENSDGRSGASAGGAGGLAPAASGGGVGMSSSVACAGAGWTIVALGPFGSGSLAAAAGFSLLQRGLLCVVQLDVVGEPVGRDAAALGVDRLGRGFARGLLGGARSGLLALLGPLVAPLELVGVERDGVAQLLEGLTEAVVERDLVLHVRGRLADLADELAEPGREVGQLRRPEEDQGEKKDDGDLAHPEVEHVLYLPRSHRRDNVSRRIWPPRKEGDLPGRAQRVGVDAP